MVGRDFLTLTNLDEEYLTSIPPVYVCGIVWGTSRVEHGQSFEIKCKKTNHNARIEFTSGTAIKGKIVADDEEVATFSGDVFGTITLDNGQVLYDYKKAKVPEKVVQPLIEQDPMESRRVWHRATYSLINAENEKAHKAKHDVEERQRALRRQGMLPDLIWFKPTGEESEEGVPMYEYIGPRE